MLLDVSRRVFAIESLDEVLRTLIIFAGRELGAERGTLFLNDPATGELYSRVAQVDLTREIRIMNTMGIAGAVFHSGQGEIIHRPYDDPRFIRQVDEQTGFHTTNILCVPLRNTRGEVIGVTQILNKHQGPFTDEDESRLKAFTAQVSIALENAKLFEDIQNIKNYNEGMLQSMSNGVITLNEDGRIVTCNKAGLRQLGVTAQEIHNLPAQEFFTGSNAWIMDKVQQVEDTGETHTLMDAELEFRAGKLNAYVSVLPLRNPDGKTLGSMVMIEDISTEKRMKSTMARYMDPGVADQLLSDTSGEELLGGKSSESTVLFSDIRSFTTISEALGAQGTVKMLNEYFTIMVDCITRQGGMLDKFIGDAIMAGFGIPVSYPDNEDRALRAALSMITELWEWNTLRTARGQLPLEHGIGLNTGQIVSGNIGSPKRMDYTMIGDAVNLASRLESATKQYHARILISQFTKAKLRGTYRMRDVDLVIVKGKPEPVGVHEVLDYHTDDSFPNLVDVVNQFNEGVKEYRKGNFTRALGYFGEALKANARDELSTLYVERCNILLTTPPKDWNGVWILGSK